MAMGRQRSRADEHQGVSENVWNEYIRISRKNKNHTFSAYQENFCYPTKTLKQTAMERGIYHTSILIARNDIMAQTHNTALKLRPPFPSAPFKSAIWGFYIRRDEQQSPSFHNFAANYSAKHFLDFMINGKPYKWLNDSTIITDSGVEIRCEQGPAIEQVIEYDLKGTEREWEIPEPYKSTFYKIRDGKKPSNGEQEPTRTAVKEARVKSKTPRANKDGLTSLADIANEIGIDPREARRILRTHSQKPDAGWAWPTEEIEAIKNTILTNR
jgi:hypothetical protein